MSGFLLVSTGRLFLRALPFKLCCAAVPSTVRVGVDERLEAASGADGLERSGSRDPDGARCFALESA